MSLALQLKQKSFDIMPHFWSVSSEAQKQIFWVKGKVGNRISRGTKQLLREYQQTHSDTSNLTQIALSFWMLIGGAERKILTFLTGSKASHIFSSRHLRSSCNEDVWPVNLILVTKEASPRERTCSSASTHDYGSCFSGLYKGDFITLNKFHNHRKSQRSIIDIH